MFNDLSPEMLDELDDLSSSLEGKGDKAAYTLCCCGPACCCCCCCCY